ncbi:MAG: SAM-dependent methyltransferase, partial [Candidatus Competibacter sp.]|nr:SAM-dependent methyltransferase [Candidatus Competibacter sp.]
TPWGEVRRHREGEMNAYDRPSRLFDGLEHIRLTIHLIGRSTQQPSLFSTCYNKWMADERTVLFNKLYFTATSPLFLKGTLPKLSSCIENSILNKLLSEQSMLSNFYSKTDPYKIFYSRKIGYFLQVIDFQPIVLDGKGQIRPPSEFKELHFISETYSKLALCCLNSNLFYWFVTVFSDCRHVNKREVDAFIINLKTLAMKELSNQLYKLAVALMNSLKETSINRTMQFKHDILTIQCIYPKTSKKIINEIDYVLAQHYGFTDEELDFIINYDIKYRMGRDAGGEEE